MLHFRIEVDVLVPVDEFNVAAWNDGVTLIGNLFSVCTVAEFGDIPVVFFITDLLPCMLGIRNLHTIFGCEFDIFLFEWTSHLSQVHEENLIPAVTVPFDLAVLFDGPCSLVLVDDPQRYADICCVEEVARKDNNRFDEAVFY